MGILTWIILGLLAGALARWLMPGDDKMGWLKTMLLGILGANIGGWAGAYLGLGEVSGINFATILTATAGAFVILFLYNKFVK